MDTNTIAGLNPATATKQEVFDFVAKQLIQQGKPAVGDDTCRYRTEDGLKCAAGHLIPDAEYRQEIEGKSVDSLVNGDQIEIPPTLARFISAVGKTFVQELQTAHDSGSFSSTWSGTWARSMRFVAERNGLNSAVLDGVA